METKTLYKGKIFDLVQREMKIDGKPCIRDVIVHPGGAAICIVSQGRILLVEQTRAAVDEKTLEIPAGMIEPGEEAYSAALRELNEEAGLQARYLDPICSFWPTPGYDTEVIHLFMAREVTDAACKLPLDEGEDIRVRWMDLCEAEQAIRDGRIRDAKTILAIYHSLLENRKV